ncbi:MAG: outer membrane protein assembly factor BamE [Candidimonas sp.]|nr:MAG: outer membrane protein assembly factor BamE [Candidimonas sp.]
MALTACGTTNWGFPYKMDVQQGNWITAEQVAQLRRGMTPDQVRFLLGSPTLQDALHADRWDYPYLNEPGYGKKEDRNFTVWFKNGLLERWGGSEQPDRQPFQKTDTGAKAIQKPAQGAVGAVKSTESGTGATPAPVPGTASPATSPAESGGASAIPQNTSSYRPPQPTLQPGNLPTDNDANGGETSSHPSNLRLQPPNPAANPSAGGSLIQPLR